MKKKLIVSTLTVLVLNLFLSASVFADTREEKDVKLADKIKSNIERLGSGQDARVEVKLKDGTKVKGYVAQIGETSFSVMPDNSASATTVPYPAAKQVKGNNLSTGVKIAIGVGIVVVILIIFGLATRSA
jgi:hypothetical protein